jgi:hypothetical protein
LEIPQNFEATQKTFDPNVENKKMLWKTPDPAPQTNLQTEWICSKLDLDDPIDLLLSNRSSSDRSILRLSEFSSAADDITISENSTAVSFNQDEIVLSDEEDEETEQADMDKETPQSRFQFLEFEFS